MLNCGGYPYIRSAWFTDNFDFFFVSCIFWVLHNKMYFQSYLKKKEEEEWSDHSENQDKGG